MKFSEIRLYIILGQYNSYRPLREGITRLTLSVNRDLRGKKKASRYIQEHIGEKKEKIGKHRLGQIALKTG